MKSMRQFALIPGLILFIIAKFVSTESVAQSVKGQSMRMHTIQLSKKVPSPEEVNERKTRVGMITPDGAATTDTGFISARDLVNLLPGYSAFFLTPGEFSVLHRKGKLPEIIWIKDQLPQVDEKPAGKFMKALKEWVGNGGRMLLSGSALHFLNAMGFEETTFRDSLKSCSDNGYGRRLGFHAFLHHPVFRGLNGGVYVLKPVEDVNVSITGLFGAMLPKQGKVVAVDWDYIFLREDSKLIFEYRPGKGMILAVGGYLEYSVKNRHEEHLSKFTENCLRELQTAEESQSACYWDYSAGKVSACSPPPESDRLIAAIPESVPWNIGESELTLKRNPASGEFWDVAGERILTMGHEQSGIEEVWAHPFMAFRDYEIGIIFSYKDTIFWLKGERPELQVEPWGLIRQYKFRRAYLKEVIVSHPTEPAGVVHYEYRGVYPARLVVRFRSNLRWMWPYSDRVTGPLCHGWNPDVNALHVGDLAGRLQVFIGGTKSPLVHIAGQYHDFEYNGTDRGFIPVPTEKAEIAGLMDFPMAMNDNLDVVFAASPEGYDSAFNVFNRWIRDPEGIRRAAQSNRDRVIRESLIIRSPDAGFNRGYQWALLSTDRFFVNTPGMGSAFVAGYSTTAKGWDGGHAINGRPGYGWYFGRDAEWSGFAVTDYGDFEKVKSQLDFFLRFQDLNGKIFHEASTSGLIHYDAADATPLFIVLAGKYFRHSNDTAWLRKSWTGIKGALKYCFSTDTDMDHLIENTNVGHGWVEGGKLFGSHSTIYMAGSWGAALREASFMAAFMKDYEAESYRLEASLQQQAIDGRFWQPDQAFYSYGMDRNGLFRKGKTILPAVPVAFRMVDPERGDMAVQEWAGNLFTTNWGARILGEDNEWFKPTGYHYGSVWPLFTGWASLAAYATGNPVQGYSWIMNNLNVYRNWGLGFVEEVLNGSVYEPSGVCPHQCWSETMVLQPAIEGMLGLVVDAPNRKITLSPALPSDWDSLVAYNIRMGNERLSFGFERRSDTCFYHFSAESIENIAVEFIPHLPPGSMVEQVRLDGADVPFTTFRSHRDVRVVVNFPLNKKALLEIVTTGGISALPLVADPRPGDKAEGIRIINTFFRGGIYSVELEGPEDTNGTFRIWSSDPPVPTGNARVISRNGQIAETGIVFPASGKKYSRIKVNFQITR